MQVSRDKFAYLGISPPTSASSLAAQHQHDDLHDNGRHDNRIEFDNHQRINLNLLGNLNATDFQVTIPRNLSAVMSNSDDEDRSESSDSGSRRTEGIAQDRRPRSGGDWIVPARHRWRWYQPTGEHAIPISRRRREHRHHPARACQRRSHAEDFDGHFGRDIAQQNIGGIGQPVIGQRKIEHEIRLQDGEVNLLGGILEDQQTKSLSGIPGLAQIPILKYLFAQTNTEHRENEIVFVLVPHIIRGAT